EKDINLAQVQDLKLLLETFGAVVHETRTPQDEAQGRTVTLDERPQLVAALPGPPPDLLISVHANSATPRRDPNHICGVETFWYWPQSQNLAEQLLSFLPAACDQNARRAERAAYRVALFPQFPSVLTERGFMVCPWELELLCDEEAMHKHSVGYLGAILNCLLPKPLPVRLLLDVLTRTEQDEIERTNLLELLRLLGSLLTPQTAPIVREIWTRMEHGVITLTGVLDLLRTVTTAITKLPRPLVRAVLLGLTSGEITADTIPDLMSRLMGQAEEKHQVEEQPTLEAPATLEGVEAKEQQKTTVAADQM
ncbi:MAG: N-acetylmuramoyl-L-alanine amidase, partial [Oscillospiraceae bacterium]|nr:N-acetylmuramoyl-L-alanine amidase [Oscillospiraceae bacterium]